jgi:hypothetical protein
MTTRTNLKWERRSNRAETLVTDRRILKVRSHVRAGTDRATVNYFKLELGDNTTK